MKILAENADVLVHEATFAKGDRELAGDYYHSTTEQAAETAKAAGAGQLILTHISARYQGESVNELVSEAKASSQTAQLPLIFMNMK